MTGRRRALPRGIRRPALTLPGAAGGCPRHTARRTGCGHGRRRSQVGLNPGQASPSPPHRRQVRVLTAARSHSSAQSSASCTVASFKTCEPARVSGRRAVTGTAGCRPSGRNWLGARPPILAARGARWQPAATKPMLSSMPCPGAVSEYRNWPHGASGTRRLEPLHRRGREPAKTHLHATIRGTPSPPESLGCDLDRGGATRFPTVIEMARKNLSCSFPH